MERTRFTLGNPGGLARAGLAQCRSAAQRPVAGGSRAGSPADRTHGRHRSNLIIIATAYAPLSVQQALTELTSLLADPVDVLQALADRNANLLHGVLGTLLTPGAVLRDRYCAQHG